uniref:Uncharacterized protein n=1 Tax=Anguilla anguilla TaxID=7936 RepID=A0A0E9SZB2_ANGAN
MRTYISLSPQSPDAAC